MLWLFILILSVVQFDFISTQIDLHSYSYDHTSNSETELRIQFNLIEPTMDGDYFCTFLKYPNLLVKYWCGTYQWNMDLYNEVTLDSIVPAFASMQQIWIYIPLNGTVSFDIEFAGMITNKTRCTDGVYITTKNFVSLDIVPYEDLSSKSFCIIAIRKGLKTEVTNTLNYPDSMFYEYDYNLFTTLNSGSTISYTPSSEVKFPLIWIKTGAVVTDRSFNLSIEGEDPLIEIEFKESRYDPIEILPPKSTQSPEPSVSSSISISASITPTHSVSPSVSSTRSIIQTQSVSPSVSFTSSITPTHSVSPSISPTVSISQMSISLPQRLGMGIGMITHQREYQE